MIYLTGFHAIEERLRSGKGAQALLVAKAPPRSRSILELAAAQHIRIERTGTHELDRVAKDHRGIALEIEESETRGASFEESLELLQERERALAVVLDEITDPHNFGAILRSCDQFSADLIVTRTDRTAKHSDVIAKASAGASAWTPLWSVPNLPRAVNALKEAGFWIYGADTDGEPVWNTKLSGRVALVLGSEGAGISRLLRECCDGLVSIPCTGRVDSLNVSVAAGVLLYETRRQMSLSQK
ncbi:MAG: 23S rRNA (guanosine(2251)-2'-O)-methyltransferase RlmB [Spirochaetaceae bacterium]|jgi:23S rRNA (guanosine2251-2'-O)-methyltransferase|nr:23S rRNA (guanosine(2251)-2'-O)-methyltransferase RlmB [Spirochaetaceae bacterium]